MWNIFQCPDPYNVRRYGWSVLELSGNKVFFDLTTCFYLFKIYFRTSLLSIGGVFLMVGKKLSSDFIFSSLFIKQRINWRWISFSQCFFEPVVFVLAPFSARLSAFFSNAFYFLIQVKAFFSVFLRIRRPAV